MSSIWSKLFLCALVGLSAAQYSSSSPSTSSRPCNVTQIEGCNATDTMKNMDGIDIYHTYPPNLSNQDDDTNSSTAILFLTDFYGIASINNKLLANHLALATLFPVIMPDLFNNDPVPMTMTEGPQLNLTDWFARHPTWQIDQVVEQTIHYMEVQLGVKRFGAVGYCLGGKHVARFMADGKGIGLGFVAHPANMTDEEVQAIAGPVSVAAGELDDIFNKTGRHSVEDILEAKDVVYRTSLFSGAPHGFAVRPDVGIPEQVYAKQGAYEQAMSWFEFWF